jgi:4a-hydroxytetrahydrobiopterin dehydratase
MPALTPKQISLALKGVPKWAKRGKAIQRTFEFKDFVGSIDFVNRVARKAQKADHHPDIDIRYNKTTLTLTTHDEGGISARDFSLAKQCDDIFDKF